MKKAILFTISTLISAMSFGQQIDFTTLQKATNGDVKGEYRTYVSKDGTIYNIGDKIKIGHPATNRTFSYINMGDGFFIPIQPLTSDFSGIDTEIIRIIVYGNKRMGFKVSFRTLGISSVANYSVDIENAIETGEIKRTGISSDEALSELKKSKDKLDLGLINQRQFDSLKTHYSKFIK